MQSSTPGTGRKLSVCVVTDDLKQSPIILYDWFFETIGTSPEGLDMWLYEAPDTLRSWADRSEMPISSIPCDPVPDAIPFNLRFALPAAGLSVPSKTKPGSFRVEYRIGGIILPRPLHDFDVIIIDTLRYAQLSDHAYLQDIAEMSPGTIFMDLKGRQGSRNSILKLHSRRAMKEMMIRNTRPLITAAMINLDLPTTFFRGNCLMVSALEVQILFRLRDKGLTDSEKEEWRRPLHALGMANLTASETEVLDTKTARMCDKGHAFLETLHPSALDPGFLDRFKAWCDDPDAHVDQYTRWIRTWSGRLRRHQAKIWKARIPKRTTELAGTVLDEMIGYHFRFKPDQAVREIMDRHPDLGDEVFLAGVVKKLMGDRVRKGRCSTMVMNDQLEYYTPHSEFF